MPAGLLALFHLCLYGRLSRSDRIQIADNEEKSTFDDPLELEISENYPNLQETIVWANILLLLINIITNWILNNLPILVETYFSFQRQYIFRSRHNIWIVLTCYLNNVKDCNV